MDSFEICITWNSAEPAIYRSLSFKPNLIQNCFEKWFELRILYDYVLWSIPSINFFMKNSIRKLATYLFMLKDKINNKGTINWITQHSYTVPYQNHIWTKKRWIFSWKQKVENPMRSPDIEDLNRDIWASLNKIVSINQNKNFLEKYNKDTVLERTFRKFI